MTSRLNNEHLIEDNTPISPDIAHYLIIPSDDAVGSGTIGIIIGIALTVIFSLTVVSGIML